MRRRADSPHGPVTQESHQQPAPKRLRHSTSPSRSSPEASSRLRDTAGTKEASATSPRIIRTTSPTRPSFPPLPPLPLMQPSQGPNSGSGERGYQSFTSAGNAATTSSSSSSSSQLQQQQQQQPPPGSWAPNWPPGHMSRHSIDSPHVILKSASASPDRGRGGGTGGGEDRERSGESGAKESKAPTTSGNNNSGSGTDIVFIRDVTNRQPRSMMACMRCRRQKMKCDGPGKEPCRGCRQAGVPCVFESRARPKSISTLPSRGSPFFSGALPPGRGGTPGTGMPPSFYPTSSVQAAPPITSRAPLIPDYGVRQVREPMPPPPPQGIGALGNAPYPPPLRAHSPPPHTPTGGPQPGYYPAPPPGPPPYVGAPGGPPPPPPAMEGRLRSLESAFRSVSTLPAAFTSIQATLGSILRVQESLSQHIGGGSGSSSAPSLRTSGVDVPEHIWEAYRIGAWPLTPWLPGMSPLPGLHGLVLSCLGRRASIDRPDSSRREAVQATDTVLNEVAHLLSNRTPWTRDDVLALGVFATWTSDPALGCLATGLARDLHLDRHYNIRKGHEEWREWIYVVLADHLLHLPDFSTPIVTSSVAHRWRELIMTPPQQSDPQTHERDLKLLDWLEFTEILVDIQKMQRGISLGDVPMSPSERRGSDSDRDPSRPGSGPSDSITDRDRSRSREIWRRTSNKLEAWAGTCGARHDPVMTLHFNYGILYASSPVFAGNDRVWNALTATHEGYQQLERSRDAAFAVIHSLVSPDIARTLAYSFPVVRPIFGLAIVHLVSMAAMIHSPIISIPHVQKVLASVVDSLAAAAPLELVAPLPPPSAHSPAAATPSGRPSSSGGRPSLPRPLPPSLLLEMVETGALVEVAKREIVGIEPDRELWRRLFG